MRQGSLRGPCVKGTKNLGTGGRKRDKVALRNESETCLSSSLRFRSCRTGRTATPHEAVLSRASLVSRRVKA